MNIGLGQSTYAYMIADPLAILEENEIHLGFSSVFHDSRSEFDQSMLHNIDVLVARLPAHLPSDVQKVRFILIVIPLCWADFGPWERSANKDTGSRCVQARVDDVPRCCHLLLKRLGLFGE